ncbi:glycosyltransferase family 2 protein [Paracoccus luteus]|uniref:glycosyltransferase family 2 protein n=1 Tax=Paracoccus luteus TaxID=2508543 RepID=UPI0010700289|nr:glycosyltransferase family 2 protein [Paracoccus luteus]
MSVTPIRRPDAPAADALPGNTVRFRPRAARVDDRPAPAAPARDRRPLGQILIEDGAVAPGDLLKALVLRRRQAARLGEVLLANGWVKEPALARALARQWRTSHVDLAASPPDARLIDIADAGWCLNNGVVPWRRVGGVTFVAASRPHDFDALRARLAGHFGTVRMLLCEPSAAREAILNSRRTRLIRAAESCVAPEFSCRTRNELRLGQIMLAGMGALAAGLWFAPVAVLALVTALVTATLAATTLVKALAFRATVAADAEARRAALRPQPEMLAELPVISVMVPMFREEDIADRLIGRLSALTYPRELTDCLLVVEESDGMTRAALAAASLPFWMRVVTVPDGPIRTKPRAMNYALNFCRGSIIGVWDAEDRPEPDQLHRVARHLHFADPRVACVQGALDFYNPRTNWLARCFTVEYSAWFRGVLPGLARMGLVVPLGGTTFFIRRAALDRAGGWDGWNVTEDADLGVRLARMGYRTEIVDTTTHEEANCRAVPWVKQRSRWLKGFAMTWGVHMRAPCRLWRELGPAAFVGFHLQMFATVQQFLLAPVLWSCWLMLAGLPHPLDGAVGRTATVAVIALFIGSEALNLVVGIWSVRRTHRHLIPWVATLPLYFPLACLAAWKAVYEIVVKPFYWDKTAHGVFDAAPEPASCEPAPATDRVAPGPRPVPVRPLALDIVAAAGAAQGGEVADRPVQVIGKIG